MEGYNTHLYRYLGTFKMEKSEIQLNNKNGDLHLSGVIHFARIKLEGERMDWNGQKKKGTPV